MLGELVSHMGLQLVPYANLLVVSLMALTSDPLADVRMAATSAFAATVALLPLAQVGHQYFQSFAAASMPWPCRKSPCVSMSNALCREMTHAFPTYWCGKPR